MNGNNRTGEPLNTVSRIRTPDQRVRVFVSSTLDELAPERVAVREAITQLRLTPVFFESGARPYAPHELYQAYVAQSDIFVGIYWQHYGWIAPAMQMSGLEDEYLLSADKPRLIYVKSPAPNVNRACSGCLIVSVQMVLLPIRNSPLPRNCANGLPMTWHCC